MSNNSDDRIAQFEEQLALLPEAFVDPSSDAWVKPLIACYEACAEIGEVYWDAVCNVYPYTNYFLNTNLWYQFCDNWTGRAILFSIFDAAYVTCRRKTFYCKGEPYRFYCNRWKGFLVDSHNHVLCAKPTPAVLQCYMTFNNDNEVEVDHRKALALFQEYYMFCSKQSNPTSAWERFMSLYGGLEPSLRGFIEDMFKANGKVSNVLEALASSIETRNFVDLNGNEPPVSYDAYTATMMFRDCSQLLGELFDILGNYLIWQDDTLRLERSGAMEEPEDENATPNLIWQEDYQGFVDIVASSAKKLDENDSAWMDLLDAVEEAYYVCQTYKDNSQKLWRQVCDVFPYYDSKLTSNVVKLYRSTWSGRAMLFSLFSKTFVTCEDCKFKVGSEEVNFVGDAWIGTLYNDAGKVLMYHEGEDSFKTFSENPETQAKFAKAAQAIADVHTICVGQPIPESMWRLFMTLYYGIKDQVEEVLMPYLEDNKPALESLKTGKYVWPCKLPPRSGNVAPSTFVDFFKMCGGPLGEIFDNIKGLLIISMFN